MYGCVKSMTALTEIVKIYCTEILS